MQYPYRIVLIEGDVDDQYVFRLAVKEINPLFELSIHTDCDAAIALFADDELARPDIIFMEWSLISMTGVECLKAIKRIPHFSAVPIVVYTSSEDPKHQQDAQQVGAAFYFTKVYTLADLIKNLRKIFQMLQPPRHSL